MRKKICKAIIISASSDIGHAMCLRWLDKYAIYGTYRTQTSAVRELTDSGVNLIHCDLVDVGSVRKACQRLKRICSEWDLLVMCPGTQEPVGAFIDCNFDHWKRSLEVNFLNQMRIVHALLPVRSKKKNNSSPCVLFFAGGGTNNATLNYSAYTCSKIALIKMCELLDAEITDTRFAIVGPGWVKTKIHSATLRAKEKAGANYKRTLEKFSNNEFTSMDEVLDCCDWIVKARRNVVSGRNFSVVFDQWGTKALESKLAKDFDMYKLRRFGNDRW